MAAEPHTEAGQRSHHHHRPEAQGWASRYSGDQGSELLRAEDRRIVLLSIALRSLAMTALRDTARAKLNLTLEVLRRRPDGFPEVRRLVAFDKLGDHLELATSRNLALVVEGPFASALSGDNLITAAAE